MRPCLAAALLACYACAAAQTPPPPPPGPAFDAALAQQIDATLAASLAAARAPGATAAVLRADGSLHEAAAGRATDERAMAPGDVLRAGSITKTFVSALIQQLANEGKLSLDDPLDRHVPQFSLGDAVTLRRLLNHTSGLFDFADDPALLASEEPIPPEEVVRLALEHERRFAPGAGWSYSNTNYILLGLVVEAVAGRPLAGVVRERLTEPLGLASAVFEGSAGPHPTATGYIGGGPGLDYDVSWSWAAGAMLATSGDLCRWAKALLLSDRVLPAASRAEMARPTDVPGGTVDYGLGLDLGVRSGHAVQGHTGSSLGFHGEVFVDPATGDCVAVQANDFMADQKVASRAIWGLLPGAD